MNILKRNLAGPKSAGVGVQQDKSNRLQPKAAGLAVVVLADEDARDVNAGLGMA